MSVETRVPNARLIQLREDAGLSQQDLADELNDLAAVRHGKHPLVTRKTVGRWERGEVVWPQPLYRRLLTERFRCSMDELGFHRPRRTSSVDPAAAGAPVDLISTAAPVDPLVERDQQGWRDVRAALGRHRHGLAVLAESLYREHRVEGLMGTGVISTPSWLPDKPVPLDDIHLELEPDLAEPTITGGEPESAAIRPLASIEARYRRYHDAMRNLAAPRLFENRLCSADRRSVACGDRRDCVDPGLARRRSSFMRSR